MNLYLRNCIRGVLLLSTIGSATAIQLARAQSTPIVQEIEVVVITGSYIDGAAQDTALPVQVITADDLEKQGSPNPLDIVKSISAVQAVFGESNQFASERNTGVSSINLRGLGPLRTLVLMNGRRLGLSAGTNSSPGAGVGVDVNLIPMSVIDRIEVLKDGAAATYGSDAIGGVVNFITRRGVDGLSIDGSYSFIDESDGDYSTSLRWGYTGQTYDVLVGGGYRHRSELTVLDRSFASRSLTENPQGGFSSFGNPGVYQLLNAAGTTPIGTFRDPGCGTLGGVETGTAAAPGCQFQFTQFDNLVEREEAYNLYAELNSELFSAVNLHLEAFYAAHDVPQENSSPSYSPTQGPGASALNPSNAPNFVIPISNPGLAALLPALTPVQQMAIAAAGGVRASGLQFRPLGLGGNPITGEGKQDSRFFDLYRLSMSFDGTVRGVRWNLGLTYSENTRDADTPDILVGQLDRALRGFGGANCTDTTPGSAANGCSYFNPFSTGISRNPVTGAVNPTLGNGGTFVANTANDVDTVRSLFGNYGFDDTFEEFVVDAVLTGEFDVKLTGGNIGWAVGLQYRDDHFDRDLSDDTNIDVNPCADTPITGNRTCTTAVGPLSFLGTLREVDLRDDVYGAFVELSLPLANSLQAQVAYRYEDYGGKVGSTSNPKIAVRWQLTDWLGVRASAGSTFRGPLLDQLVDSASTTLQFTPLARVVPPATGGAASSLQNLSGFRPYDNFGNSDLQPEDADTLNIGAFLTAGPLAASVDYYNIHLKNPIALEVGPDIVSRFFGTATAPENHCGESAFAGLQSRLTFAGNVCAPQNLLRVRTNTINGPDETTSGIDANLRLTFGNVLSGELVTGFEATYLIEYRRDRFLVEAIDVQGSDRRDFAGTRGGFGAFPSFPKLRGSAYVNWSRRAYNFRFTSRYIDGVTDVRSAVADPVTGKPFEVGSFLTHDVVFRMDLGAQAALSLSVFNLRDRDPPFARLEYNYDPFIGNPVGRVAKIALSKRFD